MTCSEAESRLDDFVDGALGEREFQELELHLAGCSACRAQERGLRALLEQAAALPRELSPPRDLWPAVAERLEPRRAQWFPRRAALSGWLPATLAAAAAVALAVAWLGRDGRVSDDSRQMAATPSGIARPAAVAATPEGLLEAERQYAQAAAALLAALQERRPQLEPEALRALERDLLVIDTALAQIRSALAQDPASGPLNHLLASTHQKKVKALQRVEKLSRI
jgi:predicted anti-sigma-YlaC factor YlaD